MAPVAVAVTVTAASQLPSVRSTPAHTSAEVSISACARVAMLFRLIPPATAIDTAVALPLGTARSSATPTVTLSMVAEASAVTEMVPVATTTAALMPALTELPRPRPI